jgi:hypothetical protein
MLPRDKRPGQWWELSPSEVEALFEQASYRSQGNKPGVEALQPDPRERKGKGDLSRRRRSR